MFDIFGFLSTLGNVFRSSSQEYGEERPKRKIVNHTKTPCLYRRKQEKRLAELNRQTRQKDFSKER